MGYSKSLRTLVAMEPNLQMLAQGKPTSWRVTEGSPGDFAYRIREALYNAHFYNPTYSPALARAYTLFRTTVDGEFVRARLKHPRTVQQVTAPDTQPSAIFVQPQSQLQTAARSLIGPRSTAEVIQFWIDCQPTNEEIAFSEAELSNEELEQLQAWAGRLTPPWELVHTAGTTFFLVKPAKRKFTTTPGPITQAIPSDKLPTVTLG